MDGTVCPLSRTGQGKEEDSLLPSWGQGSRCASLLCGCKIIDPDYEFLQQDLSTARPDTSANYYWPVTSARYQSPWESGSPFLGHPLQLPLGSCPQLRWVLSPPGSRQTCRQPCPRKSASAASQTLDSSGCRKDPPPATPLAVRQHLRTIPAEPSLRPVHPLPPFRCYSSLSARRFLSLCRLRG